MAKKKKEVSFKEMGTTELKDRIQNDKMRYQKLKFNNIVSMIEDPNVLKKIRKDIARMKTEVRAREIEAEKQAKASS